MKAKLVLMGLALALCSFFTACDEKDNEVALAGVTLSKTSVTLKPEETENLLITLFPSNATNRNLIWSSTNENVATVNNDGVITAISVGNTVVTVAAAGDASVKASCEVTVSWESLNNVSGNVSGTWSKNTTVNVSGHITIPEGQTLTIEEGVQVIFDDNGVGVNHTGIEFIVNGKLYCKGTEADPILFSCAAGKRAAANSFAGFWGGIVATAQCPEMLFDHVIIEYTGSDCLSDSPSVLAGIYTAGDDITPHITTNNPQGKYVIVNSTLRYGRSDATYFMGGNAIIANNVFYAIGETGAEAVNMKAGCKVDAAFNLIFSPNSNGFKLSSSGQDDAAGRTQALVKAYNNTVINAGWRRDGVKGGSLYIEKGAKVSVFNNLIVNCKFMAMTPKWDTPNPSNGADQASIIDYNFYASGAQQSSLTQDVSGNTQTAYAGYTTGNSNYWHDGRNGTPKVDEHSIVCASAGDANTDPKFVNYGFNTVPLTSYTFDNDWNFHLQNGSPVLSGAYSNFTGDYAPYFGTAGLIVGGVEYKTPVPAARFGAFGIN
jgi:hypothetical protein